MGRKTHKRRQRKGGCGCIKLGGRKSNTKKSRTIKSKKLTGGTNLGSLPIHYYYPYNKNPDYMMEPVTGGKKKRQRGGGALDSAYSFGSLFDLQNANQLVGAQPLTETSVTDQPAARVFQENNAPAV